MGFQSTSYTPGANNFLCDRHDGKGAIESLDRELKATRLLLEENPAGNLHEATMNPSGSKKPKRALNFVLNVLNRQELIDDLNDATNEIFVCQQNNKRAFKLVWNLYVVSPQSTGHRSSVDNVGNIQDPVGHTLDSVRRAFYAHPFAVLPEGVNRVTLPTFTILNHNHETATRYENLARRIGRSWVDDRVGKYDTRVQDLVSLQTSLFGLLWSGTVEQLKWPRTYESLDNGSERPEFENAVEELERTLRRAMVCSRRSRFVVAFCGMVNAGTSMFLNAFMGRAVLLSDGEINALALPLYSTEYHYRAPFYRRAMPASPC